jgi:hypothetical protein
MTPQTAQRLREAAQQVVTEARAVEVPGGVLLAVMALDDVLREIDANAARGRVTSRRLDQRLRREAIR